MKKCDESALLLLLRAPKKKYLKQLIQLGIAIQLCNGSLPSGYATSVSQNFQADLELTVQQSHRLLNSLSAFVSNCLEIDFDFEHHTEILSEDFDEELRQLLCATALERADSLKEQRAKKVREGEELIDLNWKLDLQVFNQKGKCNAPNVILELDTVNSESTMKDWMINLKGNQFKAFFGNLRRIKDQLTELVTQS